jgi:SHS family lactate transporter-like MFS transporter
MTPLQSIRSLTKPQRRAFTACFLGWTLDSFDFFILVWCLDSVASSFHVSLETATTSFFWTLCMRPLGALLFGALAERYGRRPVLMLNIICFSVFELSSAFAPTFGVFLLSRALFGIAMGGEWGVGAALAFETLPSKGRGFFSGVLQEGYVCGNLLAAALYGVLFPHLHGHGVFTNWRVLFMVGALPALLVVFIQAGVPESPVWQARRSRIVVATAVAKESVLRQVAKNLPSFLFLVLMMTAFMSFSHGTQDLYPTFLKRDLHLAKTTASWVGIVGNLGALVGGIVCGTVSEKFGRRKAIVFAALLAIPMVPLWLWSHTALMLAAGGFLLQFMVQGAWGVVPVHLNELSPPAVRAIFPGLAYQLGNLLTSFNAPLQTSAAVHWYGGRLAPVLGWTVVIVACAVAATAGLGREARGADLSTV